MVPRSLLANLHRTSAAIGLNVPTVINSILLTMGLEQMVYGFLGAIILLYLAILVWTIPGWRTRVRVDRITYF